MRRKIKGKSARSALSKAIRTARRSDAGKGDSPYNYDRPISEAPFYKGLVNAISATLKAKTGQVRVLDKGAGTGRMLTGVKKIDPARINTTALTLSKTISPKNRPSIDRVVQASGIVTKHAEKYAIIYDCYGEDYHLPKTFAGKSIANSVSHLRKGGILFTIIPLLYKPNTYNFTVEEGKKFIRDLRKKKPNLVITARYISRRVNFNEYLDLVVRIRKP